MSLLWTSADMVEAMDGRSFGQLPAGITGISIDTRSLQPGDAFFAIKGDVHDGHDFATAAVKAGAALLVVAEGKLPALGRLTTPMIVVDDVLGGLERLAVAARARATGKIIAVTGSAGKTTTKEALRTALSAVGTVHASDKSFNNHWGVPLTLARMPRDVDHAVFEIGMNHPGEIRPLVGMVRPHVAIVTLIAAAHLGHFSSLDEIATAKAEIFEGVVPDGHVLLNRDDDHYAFLARLARKAGVAGIRSFGEAADADYRLVACTLAADHSTVAIKAGARDLAARIGAPGRHMVQNVLAVVGATDLVGADLDAVCGAMADLRAEEGRGRRHRLAGGITLIDESYNANPASMKAAIALLDGTDVGEGGRRVAVLGDMLELGAHSRALHEGIAELIGASRTDLVFLAGPEMKALADILPAETLGGWQPDVAALVPVVSAALGPGDAVMVKSSKGIGFSRLVAALLAALPGEPESKERA